MIADRIEDCKEVPYGDVLRFNPCIQSSCRAHPQRFNALAALGKKSFDVVVYEALGINWKTKILQRVSNIKGALITRLVALKHKARL